MRANLFRGGGVLRSGRAQHEIGCKKVRALALRHALSQGQGRRHLLIDKATVDGGKTKASRRASQARLLNALIIDGAEVDAGLRLAARNLPNIDVLRSRESTSTTFCADQARADKAAVDALEARFK